jgi:hypothetical protein
LTNELTGRRNEEKQLLIGETKTLECENGGIGLILWLGLAQVSSWNHEDAGSLL